MYSSFFVINVCNQGKVLCSPCIFLFEDSGDVLSKKKLKNCTFDKHNHRKTFLLL